MTTNIPLSLILKTDRLIKHVTSDIRDLSFSSSIPGGYESCETTLDRPLKIQPDEIFHYAQALVVDNLTGKVIWEGRLKDPGRGTSDDGLVWNLVAMGPASHATDVTLPLIYADRRIADPWIEGSGTLIKSAQMSFGDEVVASIEIIIPRGTVVTIGGVHDIVEITYQAIRAAGQKLARIELDHVWGVTDADWHLKLQTATDNGASPGNIDNDTASTATQTMANVVGDANFVDGHNVIRLRVDRDGTNVTVANDNTYVLIRDITVRSMLKDALGNDITTGYTLNTVYAHEVVRDLVGRVLPLYDGTSANIATTTFAIKQLAYGDGITAAGVLEDLIQYEPTFYWAAWETNDTGKHFFEWREWPTHVRYDATAEDGFESPESADELYNRVVVRYLDSLRNVQMIVRTQSVPVLDNAGVIRQGYIDLGDSTSELTDAQRAGDQFLAQHSVAPNAGRLRIARQIIDYDTGRMVNPWEIRPGHIIRVAGIMPRVDALNPTTRDGVSVFRIISMSYGTSDSAAELELDSFAPSVPRSVGHMVGSRGPFDVKGKYRKR